MKREKAKAEVSHSQQVYNATGISDNPKRDKGSLMAFGGSVGRHPGAARRRNQYRYSNAFCPD
jgi:hypothetical protein